MENYNKVSKIFLFLCTLSFILWSGTYFSKFLLLYQFYEPEMTLRSIFNNVDFTPIFYTISSVIGFNIIFYPLFLFSLVLFFITSKLSLKKEGWFFIIFIFTLISAPFEIYSLTYDYKIVNMIFNGNFANDTSLLLIKEKIVSLGSFPFVQFAFIAAISFLAIFKPLRKVK